MKKIPQQPTVTRAVVQCAFALIVWIPCFLVFAFVTWVGQRYIWEKV